MSAASATLAGRRAAEALMADTCTIVRVTGRGSFNTSTGTYGASASSSVYSGKCRVMPRDNEDHVVAAGDRPIALWPFVVSVPMSATGIDVDHLVTITAVGESSDPELVGMVLRVRQVAHGTHITARRLGCEVNVG
jgi:hypothetical protein